MAPRVLETWARGTGRQGGTVASLNPSVRCLARRIESQIQAGPTVTNPVGNRTYEGFTRLNVESPVNCSMVLPVSGSTVYSRSAISSA
jgi:hypothetical protein